LRGHGNEQTEATVEIRQRRGTLFVNFHTNAYRFRPIIFTLNEWSAALIANAFPLRGASRHVVHGLARFAGAPSSQAHNDFVDWQFEIQHRVEREILFLQKRLQVLRLCHCSRETIEEETASTAQAVHALMHHLQHRGVGNQITASHTFKSGGHRGTAFSFPETFSHPENIARREMTCTEMS
jgi:hypothetical protein